MRSFRSFFLLASRCSHFNKGECSFRQKTARTMSMLANQINRFSVRSAVDPKGRIYR